MAAAFGVDWPMPESNLLLPVGISFYTFQTLAYAIDVYRGDLKPERHLGRFALYVAFWPQLVAGPISGSYQCYNYALGTLDLHISGYCDARSSQALTETCHHSLSL